MLLRGEKGSRMGRKCGAKDGEKRCGCRLMDDAGEGESWGW